MATAAVAIPVVLLVNRLGGWPFAVVIGAAAAVGAWECARLFRGAGERSIYVINVPAAVLFAVAPAWSRTPQALWVGVGVGVFALLAVINLMPAFYSPLRPNWLLSLTPCFYAGILLGHLHLLRDARSGAWWVFAILLMTWAYDTGAYFVGSYVGKHPFMHHVSPKKTVEGVVGGLALAAAAGLVMVPGIGLAAWQAPLLGLCVGVVAQLGDLVESMLKRQTGMKDSGGIVPGHGGLLDRIDSLLLTGALGYYAALALGYAT